MEKTLYAYKLGDLQSGNWQWAIGADCSIQGNKRPLCVASVNFHGAIKAGFDPEKAAPLFAAAPDMLAALQWWQAQMQDDNCDDMGALLDEMSAKASAAIAKAKGQ